MWRTVVISIIIILSSLSSGLIGFTHFAEAANDSDGVLTVDTKIIVSGVYHQVRVKGSGHMIVESTLETAQLIFEKGSTLELSGGKIVLCDTDSPGADVFLKGECKIFKMVTGAEISLRGTLGSSDIGKSSGGNVEFHIEIADELIIDNSVISVSAGDGYSKPTPGAATNISIADFQYAGGNASMQVELGPACRELLKNSTVSVYGGSGGKAADGERSVSTSGGRGGGYSNGGDISGNVGKGGNSKFTIMTGEPLALFGMNISVTGGSGGDAGDGNVTITQHGGGGGGYSGGDGGSLSLIQPEMICGKAGGDVGGNVGAGGNASLEIISGAEFELENCNIQVNGGVGGNAGPHSPKPLVNMPGGTGGGGYGGGGGGAGYISTVGTITTYGGPGGNISGNTGAGGPAELNFKINNDIICESSRIYLSGGPGGSAGAGTTSKVGGGGGGGFGGGGGGGGSFLDGVSIISAGGPGGSVADNVSIGGNSILTINSTESIQIFNSIIKFYGGAGGPAGAGGSVNNTNGGSGGGGFGGGGGGGKNGNGAGGSGGNSSEFSGSPASGGSGALVIEANSKISIRASDLEGSGGSGGLSGTGGKYISGKGGAGGGGFVGGGGGGGSASASGGPGGSGSITSTTVAAGGDVKLELQASIYSISRSSHLAAKPGTGAAGTTSPGGTGGSIASGYGAGGAGTGKSASAGKIQLKIPMGTPDLLEPEDSAKLSNAYPKFSWIPQHNSTGFGNLTGHRLEIDDSDDFKSPLVISYSKSGFYELLNPLMDGDYHWRVRAEYESSTPGWSEVRMFIVDSTEVLFLAPGPSGWVRNMAPNCSIEIRDQHTAVDISSIKYAYSTTDTMPDSFSAWSLPDNIIDASGDNSKVMAYAHPSFHPGTNNYVKWRAMDIVGNGFTESSIFNIKIDTSAPLLTVLGPENGSFYGTGNPEFKWFGYDDGSGLSGNCSLEVYKLKSHKKDQLVYAHNGTVAFNSSSVFDLLPEKLFDYGSYSFRVSVSDNAGHWSGFSDDTVFHVDTVGPFVEGLVPVTNQWVDTAPEFTWTALDSFAGVSYEFVFELAGDASFNKLLYHIAGGYDDLKYANNGMYTLSWVERPPLAAGTYFWRVSALGNEGLWSNFSKPLKFRVDDALPYIVPELPRNGSWVAEDCSFRFYAADSGSGLSGNYRVQVGEEPEFVKPVIDETLTLSPVEINKTATSGRDGNNTSTKTYLEYKLEHELTEFVYFWRVFAEDNVGHWSTPSITRELLVDASPPKVFMHSPGRNDWAGNNFELSWAAFDDQSGLSGKYHVQIAQNTEFSGLLVNTTIEGSEDNYIESRYHPAEILPEGRLYWRVCAEDTAGNICQFTIPISFNLDLTGVVFSPAENRDWYDSDNVSYFVELLDNGAGVDTENIYFRASSSGIATYSNWKPVPQPAINRLGINRVIVSVPASCSEGLSNFVQVRARDRANDEYQESPNYRVAVDISPVIFSESTPDFDDWQISASVNCGIAIFDLLSGVSAESIEYRYTSSDIEDLGPWLKYGNSYQHRSSGEIVCHLQLAFKSGDDNFIQWRVKDNAGNGYFESDIFQIKVSGMLEDENEKKLEPRDGETDETGWGWLVSSDGIFMIRLFVIMLVMLILFGLLRRHSSQAYTGVASGKKKGSKNTQRRGDLIQPRENLEDVMRALEHELKSSYTTRRSERNTERAHKCAICHGVVTDDDTVLDCTCGKDYHVDCVSRVGKCIGCGKII